MMTVVVYLIGIAAGFASALYLFFNYHPLLVNGAIHAAIFGSGLVAMYFAKRRDAKSVMWYLAGALPVHLTIHFMVIGDLAQLITVSHILLNFSSLP
ncbi:MAG TPA: hypothetical protein VNI77_03655 [Nitrososphaera sp.]|nr:hypothetical protein [Nitrososphaera sp.]